MQKKENPPLWGGWPSEARSGEVFIPHPPLRGPPSPKGKVFYCNFSRAFLAASCSARFLLLPMPSPTEFPLTQTCTTNSLL